MEISIKDNVKEVQKQLTRVQRKQIPFATSQAINDVAFESRKVLMAKAQTRLHNPTATTIKGFLVEKAQKTRLYGRVYIKPFVNEYLRYQIEGGTRSDTMVPVSIRLNKYGNIPARKKGIIKNTNQFLGTVKGVYGIWERGRVSNKGNWSSAGKARKDSIRLLAAFENTVKYKPRFNFYRIVNVVVDNTFNDRMNMRLKSALQSAK